MQLEELTPQAIMAYSTLGNYPHEIQLRELGLTYNDLPADLKADIRAAEGAFRLAKNEASKMKAINRSIAVADFIISYSESGRADAPTEEELEAKRQAEEQARLQAEEQARLQAEAEAKKKKSFGFDTLDFITGNF